MRLTVPILLAFEGNAGTMPLAMSKPYLLKPTFDRKRNKWRLNLPAQISPSGKRERHLFKGYTEALAEANKIRMGLP